MLSSLHFPQHREEVTRAEAERALRLIARSQHGPFTRKQAIDAGVPPNAIDRYVRTGRWSRLHVGVYLESIVQITWRQLLSGALLACGPLAVASGLAALAVWGFTEELFAAEVAVPRHVNRRRPGIIAHRERMLRHINRDGFRVTRADRTLIDVAGRIPDERLERFVDDAHRRRLIDLRRLAADLSSPEHRARRGTAVLREIVAARDPDRPIDSDLESIFFAALRAFKVPLPVPQHLVNTARGRNYIDFAYPDRMVAIELDGWEEHGTRRAFTYDRARQNDLERLRWRFNRFTWDQVKADPAGVAMTVALMLGLVPIGWR